MKKKSKVSRCGWVKMVLQNRSAGLQKSNYPTPKSISTFAKIELPIRKIGEQVFKNRMLLDGSVEIRRSLEPI